MQLSGLVVLNLPSLGPIDKSIKISACMRCHQVGVYSPTKEVVHKGHGGNVRLTHGRLAKCIETVV